MPRKHYSHTLQFKQTLIPIMLTLGAIGLVSAVIPFMVTPDSALASMREQTGLIGAMAGVGVIFLAFAVMNMLVVKSALQAAKSQ